MTITTEIRRAVLRASAAASIVFAIAACGSDDKPTDPVDNPPVTNATSLTIRGLGAVADRYTAEVWVRGTTAYTTTWGLRNITFGDAVKIWDVSGDTPILVDSLILTNAGTTGDVQVSDNGQLLAVAIEPRPNGGLALYSLADPRKPQLITRYTNANLQLGVHTAEIARVNGTLYAFCAIDPGNGIPAKLVILDLTNPATPVEVSVLVRGSPYIHDVFVREGYLFTAEWNDGVGIWDIGAISGSPANPKKLGQAVTSGGSVHNVWWYHASNGSKKYLFVGQEGPGQVATSSFGDVHVVDVSNFAAPTEVAVFNLPNAGTHNFSVDETNDFLYAAYYNGGLVALDVRGDLSNCAASARTTGNRCDLTKMGRYKSTFTKPAAVQTAYMWGVQYLNGAVYASDMWNGLWKLAPATR